MTRAFASHLHFTPLEGLFGVEVASWDGDEGWRLWRTHLNSDEDPVPGTAGRLSLRIGNNLVHPSYVATFRFGSLAFEVAAPDTPEAYAMLRWALPALGLMEEGASPVGGRITERDPRILRFRATTEEELARDALTADQAIRKHLAGPYFSLPISFGPTLFADDSGIVFVRDDEYNGAMMAEVHGRLSLSSNRLATTSTRSFREMIPWLRDRQGIFQSSTHPSWWAMLSPEADAWMREHTTPGRFSISDEEVELYQMLGEPLPYLWDNVRLRSWALDRWSCEP